MVFRDSKVSTGNLKKPPMARSHSFRSLKRLFEIKQISKSIFSHESLLIVNMHQGI